jgi:hypothetical protein
MLSATLCCAILQLSTGDKGEAHLTGSRVGSAPARIAGMIDPRRQDHGCRRVSSPVPANSAEFAIAPGHRNSCRRAESESAASRSTRLFLVALTGWRVWNFRQAPARVDLLLGRTFGWRGVKSHRNPPRTFQPSFRCLAGDGIRRLYWFLRLLAGHRSHSFNCAMVAARSRPSSNVVQPETRTAMTAGHSEPSAGSISAVGREFAQGLLCTSPGNVEHPDHRRPLTKLCRTGSQASSHAANDRTFLGRRAERASLTVLARRDAS